LTTARRKVEVAQMNKALSEAVFDEQTKNLADPRLLKVRMWVINEINYPIVDITFQRPGRRPFRVRLKCDKWNSEPPPIELLSEGGSYLSRLPSGSGVLNQGPHPTTGRPFICSPGALEYHIHSSHVTDHWENYKGKSSFDLGGIITQIWNAWRKTND
jgi:hypothetical protein